MPSTPPAIASSAAPSARSWQGRQLRYALVGDPEHVTPAGLAAVQEAVSKLRDPETSAREAERLARTTPVVLWLMGNVHGDEESATDAELRVLYELADRDDCAARQILDNAVVGIIPTQNPDGREAETRQNSYGFDMNRDWFARTQVETDTKLELLRRYPGMLYIDGHEMGGNHYFFPPTADPTYHEISSQSMSGRTSSTATRSRRSSSASTSSSSRTRCSTSSRWSTATSSRRPRSARPG